MTNFVPNTSTRAATWLDGARSRRRLHAADRAAWRHADGRGLKPAPHGLAAVCLRWCSERGLRMRRERLSRQGDHLEKFDGRPREASGSPPR